jgi:hypothetical protein
MKETTEPCVTVQRDLKNNGDNVARVCVVNPGRKKPMEFYDVISDMVQNADSVAWIDVICWAIFILICTAPFIALVLVVKQYRELERARRNSVAQFLAKRKDRKG